MSGQQQTKTSVFSLLVSYQAVKLVRRTELRNIALSSLISLFSMTLPNARKANRSILKRNGGMIRRLEFLLRHSDVRI